MSTPVEVSELVKVFGEVRALDSLSLQINKGEIYGLIGPNGARSPFFTKTSMLDYSYIHLRNGQ